jgi:hypothetical protein
MAASFAADAVLLLHGVFILFVVAGGLLALRWPLAAAVHLPCAAWGAYIEFSGGICPLTPLEQRLRALAGEAGYSGGFIEHYLLPLIYPAGLTPTVQVVLGSGVIVVNLIVYGLVLRRRRSGARR